LATLIFLVSPQHNQIPDVLPFQEVAYASEEPAQLPPVEPQEPVLDAIKAELAKTSLSAFDKQRLQDIALCESSYTQFEPDGSVLRGKLHPSDIGTYQINEKAHTRPEGSLDFYTLRGNILFAIALYREQGSTPWNPSKVCWSRSPAHW